MKHLTDTIREALTLATDGPVVDREGLMQEALTALTELERMAGEPMALLVRKNSWNEGQWECAPPNTPHYGLTWANKRMFVYAAPPAQQPQAEAVHNKPVRVCHIKDVACSEAAVKCGECPDAAPPQAEAVTPGCVVDRGFRWDGEKQQHIPQLTIEFEPVPANGPYDAQGWKDRDAVAKMFAAQGEKP